MKITRLTKRFLIKERLKILNMGETSIYLIYLEVISIEKMISRILSSSLSSTND